MIQMALSRAQKQWVQCLPHIRNVSRFIHRIFQLYFLHVLFLCIFQGNATGEFEFNKCGIWGAIKSSKHNQVTALDQRPTKKLQEIFGPSRRLRQDKCLLDSKFSSLGRVELLKVAVKPAESNIKFSADFASCGSGSESPDRVYSGTSSKLYLCQKCKREGNETSQ